MPLFFSLGLAFQAYGIDDIVTVILKKWRLRGGSELEAFVGVSPLLESRKNHSAAAMLTYLLGGIYAV